MQAIEGGHMLIILLFIVRNLKRTMETIPFSTNNMSFGRNNITNVLFYQSPLLLTELFQHNLINVSYLTACYLLSGHDDVALFE